MKTDYQTVKAAELAEVIENLSALQGATLGSKRSVTARAAFRSLLLDVTSRYAGTKEPTLTPVLLNAWMHRMHYIIYESRVCEAYSHEFDRFTAMLFAEGIAQKVAVNPAYRDTLLCTILTRVLLAEDGHEHPKRCHMGDLLEAGFDIKVPQDTLTDFKACTSFLFGNAVWVLYETDIANMADDYELPAFFTSLQLPFQVQSSALSGQEHGLAGLPHDMS